MLVLFFFLWLALLSLSVTYWTREEPRRRVGMWFLFGLPVIFLAHWYAARIVIPLFVWAFILGDNGGWFFDASTYLTLIPAAVMTFFIAARVMLCGAAREYATWNCVGSAVVLLVIGSFHAHHFLSQIQGSTPEAAARSIAARSGLNSHELQLVPVKTEMHFPSGKCLTYRGIDGSGPRCRITVCRHGW